MARSSPFRDRRDAGCQLAAALPVLDPDNTVVLALPRGGVPVAEEICRVKGLPLDLVLVQKIGLLRQPELAVGAVADGPHPVTVVNSRIAQANGLDDDRVEAIGRSLLPEIERRRALYLGDRPSVERRGKVAVVVDDGAATGATLRAGLLSVRTSKPSRIILALPVAAPEVMPELSRLSDAVVCLQRPRPFWSVGACYDAFPQVSDEEVTAAMERYGASDLADG